MNDAIDFFLDNQPLTAQKGETIWAAAKRHGKVIPHLCHCDRPGYRPDGNCRICMVEIEGERTLAPACKRFPTPGMKVNTESQRARQAREMVMELLLADQPDIARDEKSSLLAWAEAMNIRTRRFSRRTDSPAPDASHPAMAVNLDACIHCNLCIRACREVQVNQVMGMAGRGKETRVVFDLEDPMGDSTCVGCGECVQACPTGALMPDTLVDGETGQGARLSQSTVQSVCPYCGVGCQVDFHVKEGRIAWVDGAEGPSNQHRLCVKGRFGFDYIYSGDRLMLPLIRREDRPKSGIPTILPHASDWQDIFRPASWEEALNYAARGLKEIRDRDGGEALAGFGSAKCSNEEAYLFQKLVRTGFHTNNVDHCTRLCHASSVAALLENLGSGAVSAPFDAALDAEVILVVGANPTENHPVAATYFKQAARDGACLILADPRAHDLSVHADFRLQFTPGTDVALFNAIMHTIVAEELHDTEFIEQRTRGFDAFKTHLADYPPEKMAPVCGIDAETLKQVARTFARAKTAIIFWGMGVSQHTHGTDNSRCLISLSLLCGQIGRPGTGLHPLRGQNNVQGASDAGLIPMMYPDYAPVSDSAHQKRFEKFWKTRLSPTPGLTVVETVQAMAAGGIKGMYILGENPAMSDPDLTHARAALAKLEHLVVQDLFITETAWFADVILPAAAWPEKSGTVTNTNRQVQMGRPAVSPPDGCRQDWWCIQEIANRLGLNWNYTGPKAVFTEMAQTMPSLDHITWDRLNQEDSVTYPCPGPDQPGQAIVFAKTFPTPDGRAGFTPSVLTSPWELPDEEFPFVLTTGRQLEHWHTGAMTRRSRALDALEPGPTASLHPDTLKALGSGPGEKIQVTTRRGSIFLTARADTAVASNMVFIPFAYVEAAANILTHPALDPHGKIPEFKYCAAQVNPLSN